MPGARRVRTFSATFAPSRPSPACSSAGIAEPIGCSSSPLQRACLRALPSSTDHRPDGALGFNRTNKIRRIARPWGLPGEANSDRDRAPGGVTVRRHFRLILSKTKESSHLRSRLRRVRVANEAALRKSVPPTRRPPAVSLHPQAAAKVTTPIHEGLTPSLHASAHAAGIRGFGQLASHGATASAGSLAACLCRS